ncbi:MAG: nucleotidyl transferase AbiEii/AbiGii toxin family protein, partial [Sediminibacterium sp.]|nr:nucleotidyl transferase AbiEii/AbiGii toxin family protein [Sediminibacterium sp.]
ILNPEQKQLLILLKNFYKEYYLVGGTAIALQIGHRESVDFDLFNNNNPSLFSIKKTITKYPFNNRLIYSNKEQVHFIIHNVKFTFFNYPFNIKATIDFENFCRMPDLLTLAAMKTLAMAQRSKWKDYVDLFFLLKNYFTIKEISTLSNFLFPNVYSEKLFRQQIAYHKLIDYSEQVVYSIKNPPSDEEIKDFLIQESLRF